MFIRFVSGAINEDSRVAAGLFCAVEQILSSGDLPRYEADAINALEDWFEVHLESPLKHLLRHGFYEPGVCWFKATAHEHLARAWELVGILERNDVLIWTIKSEWPGLVYYEDDAQVCAAPCRQYVRRMRR